MATPCILVIEDQKSVRDAVCGFFDGLDVAVHGASDGLEALKFISTTVPDIVIADINMPGLDGLKFSRALRDMPGGKTTDLIFLSASQSAAQVAAGINLGARFFLAKPVNKTELIRKVSPLIDRKRAAH